MMQRGLEVLMALSRCWAIREEAVPALAQGANLGMLAKEVEMGSATPEAARTPAPIPITGGVAVIPLKGVIRPNGSLLQMLFGGSGAGGLNLFRQRLREAAGNPDISSILIDIDSPGGVIDLVPEAAAEIRAARERKKIVAVANTMAGSAAYWLASQADELVVTPSGEVGSIGVFVLHEEYSKMDERLGITTTLIKAGRYKAEGNPFEELSDEAKAAIQATVDEYYGMFTADVAEGRGVADAAVRNGFGQGRMLTAKNAVRDGLADRVETFEQTAKRLVGSSSSRRADDSENNELLAQVRDQLDQTTSTLKEGH